MSNKALNLPAEIQQLVLKNLELPSPLFRPVYGEEPNSSDEGSLQRKYRSYWGLPRTIQQNEGVLALINLSRTSRFYADLLAPMMYETIVLRPTPASLAFVSSIQQSPRWPLVKYLVVCTVYKEVDEMWDGKVEENSLRDLLKYRKQADIEEGLALVQKLGAEPGSQLEASTKSLREDIDKASESNNTKASEKTEIKLGEKTDDNLEYNFDPTGDIDFDTFSAVLRQLPPNLCTLTIDTPTYWFECFDCGEYLDFFVHETAEELLENEQEYVYRKQIYTIYTAICCEENVTMLKKRAADQAAFEFELRLLNVPPFPCSEFPGATEYPCAKQPDSSNGEDEDLASQESRQSSHPASASTGSKLSELLGLVTLFEISFCWWENGAGWHMNTHPLIQSFTASLPTYLFNHLSDRCKTFLFYGDKSWILGDFRCGNTSMNPLPLDTEGHTVASEYESPHISLPGFRIEACNKVRNVEIRNAFVGPEILHFIASRSAMIQTLRLLNCWAHCLYHEEENRSRTWARFLCSLASTVSDKLQSVEIAYDIESTDDITGKRDVYDEDGMYLKNLEFRTDRPRYAISTATTSRSGKTRKSKSIKQEKEKFMFGYGSISDKYGDLLADNEASEESLKDGEDWKAWLELVDIVHNNSEGTLRED